MVSSSHIFFCQIVFYYLAIWKLTNLFINLLDILISFPCVNIVDHVTANVQVQVFSVLFSFFWTCIMKRISGQELPLSLAIDEEQSRHLPMCLNKFPVLQAVCKLFNFFLTFMMHTLLKSW